MQTSSTLVAYWGAILSTLLAIWTVYKDLRDSGKLKVAASLYEWDEVPPIDEDEDSDGSSRRMYEVEFTITNVGRRPVNVIALGYGNIGTTKQRIAAFLPDFLKPFLRLSAQRYEATFRTDDHLPKKLDAADFITIKWDKLQFLQEKDVSLFVSDSLGHYFFVSKTDMQRLKRNYDPPIKRPSTVDHVIGRVRF